MIYKKNGFTLIELLVVIAIIGILAAIIISATYVLKQKARVAAGKGMLSSIPAAMQLCIDGGGSVMCYYDEPNVPCAPRANMPICDDQSITNSIYPDLSGSHWVYLQLSVFSYGEDRSNSPNTYLDAGCKGLYCGKTNYAKCSISHAHATELHLGQAGCLFYTFP